MPSSSQIFGSCGVGLAGASSCCAFTTLGADVVGRASGERGKYQEGLHVGGRVGTLRACHDAIWPGLCSCPAARIVLAILWQGSLSTCLHTFLLRLGLRRPGVIQVVSCFFF